MNKRPNVLLILTDQMRRDSLGCHGGPAVTPNLDALAKEGVSFRNAYCVYPMCTPARAALLTGRFPHALRMEGGDSPYYENNQLLDTGEVTYAKELQKAGGDRCAYIGKWHNDCQDGGKVVPRGPRRQGFDHFWRGVETGASHVSPEYFDDENRPLSFEGAWDPDVQAGMACDFLSRQDGEASPFCLVVSISPPHDPWDLPGGRSSLLAEASSRIGPASLRPNVPTRLQDQALEDYVRYHANILGVDDCVGRILEALRKTGHETDTIVLFTSDHGDSLHSHGLRQKNQFHEEASAVPLILRWPKGGTGGALLWLRSKSPVKKTGIYGVEEILKPVQNVCALPVSGDPFYLEAENGDKISMAQGNGLISVDTDLEVWRDGP